MLRAMAKLPVCLAIVAVVACAQARAVDCATTKSGDISFTTCRVDLHAESLRIFYADADGKRYGGFSRLRDSLANAKRELLFAMNGGMYHPDYQPVGLLVIDGQELAPINRSTGDGNFFLQPNGVFLIDDTGARVVATDDYRDEKPIMATQSGPMLLHRGLIPDMFSASSKSRHLRNGVCAPKPDQAVFVISEDEVTFRQFAEYFRDVLGCSEALYLDGTISSLYAPALKRADQRAELGPIVGVVR